MLVVLDTHVHVRQAGSDVDGPEEFDGEVLSDDVGCTSDD
jgi:hypothetical protein